MLTFLRISGFALIERVELTLRPRPHRHHRRDRRGQEHPGRRAGAAARAARGSAEADPHRARRGGGRGACSSVPAGLAGARAAGGRRAQPGRGAGGPADDRPLGPRAAPTWAAALATVAELAASVGTPGRHHLAARPAVADGSRQPAGHPGRLRRQRRRWSTRPGRPGRCWPRREADLAGFEAEARARAEREDYLRFQLTRAGRGGAGPRRGRRPEGRSGSGCAGRRSSWRVFARGEEALYAGDGAAAAQIAGGGPRPGGAGRRWTPALAPLAERLRNAQALVEDVAGDLGAAGRAASASIPNGWRRSRSGCYLHRRGCAASTGARVEPRCSSGSRAWPASWASWARSRRGCRPGGRAVDAAQARMAGLSPRRCPSGGARRPARWASKIDETLRELGLREAAREGGGRGQGAARAQGVRPGAVPVRPQPGRGGARRWRASPRAASCRGSCWRSSGRWPSADRALTYVFDEVDTGVGGGTAEVIGRKLKAIAADRQVLAVTHLPQIAAFADQHLRVDKADHRRAHQRPHRPAWTPSSAPSETRPHAGRRPALARGRRPTPTRCCAGPASRRQRLTAACLGTLGVGPCATDQVLGKIDDLDPTWCFGAWLRRQQNHRRTRTLEGATELVRLSAGPGRADRDQRLRLLLPGRHVGQRS